MEASQIYILIAIIVLLLIAIIVFFTRKDKKQKKLTPLAILSFVFVIAGICFGDDRIIGYSLITIGILFAVIDIVIKSKKIKKR